MKNKFLYVLYIFLGIILIHSKLQALTINSKAEIIFIKEDNFQGESLFYQDIVKLGYTVDEIIPDSVTLEKLEQYSLVVLSTGNYPFACQNFTMRLAIQDYIVENLGKVLIEGGNNGYISAVFPGYVGFRTKVIKIDNWLANDGGSLNISNSQQFSTLATEPNILPQTININYESIYNQDVCINDNFSELFYGTANYPDNVGILVAPNVNNPQIINYFNTYSSFADNSVAIKLLQNSLYNLIGKPVSVVNISGVVPFSYDLHQNYPNPFNPSTKIKFDIKPLINENSVNVKLVIYNTEGKQVAVIANGKFSYGIYEAEFNASGLAGGVYFYKLSVTGGSDSYSQTKKMILLN